jgi:hypothetical protein
MASLTAEVTWLRWLLENFGVPVTTPTSLLLDSTGAISIARDPVKHELSKHIGADASFVLTFQYVPFELLLADFFTKTQTRT